MKITKITSMIVGLGFRNGVFVEVQTDEGIVGIGETAINRRTLTVKCNIDEIAPLLIGRDPLRIEDHWEKLYRDSFWLGGPLHATAISLLDAALWDIKGKFFGAPVYQLLGGPTRDFIPTYCHCPSGSTPEEFAANLKQVQSLGYRAAKTTLPLFYGGRVTDTQFASKANGLWYSGAGGQIDSCLKETELLPCGTFEKIAEFFAAAREAVGKDFELAVDCHGRLSPANAIRLCNALAPYNLMFIEEPIPPEDPDALAEVARRSSTPIAAGERLATIYGVRPFLERRALAILQCDVANCGGITASKKIAALAEASYVCLAPHNPNGPVATAMTVHLAASIPNFLILEMIGSPSEEKLHSQVVDNPLWPKDGLIKLPEGPGLGLNLLPDLEERMPFEFNQRWR